VATLLVGSALAAVTAATVTAPAGANGSRPNVEPRLAQKADAARGDSFRVIVRAERGTDVAALARKVDSARAAKPGKGKGVSRKFVAVTAVAAELTGDQIDELAGNTGVAAISEDLPMAANGPTSNQLWPSAANVTGAWSLPKNTSFPAIAIVDSGVDSSRADLSNRVAAQVSFASVAPNSAGDGYGHGTLVAALAAGGAAGYAGVVPRAKVVSLDVLNDYGVGYMSDAIAAVDWILQNKAAYNIRVANFSINAGAGSSFMYDPLDAAVRKLWLNGVVVVTAAGNYGFGSTPSGVVFSPANDPFVITVGASDVNGTSSRTDDFAAPWTAWGYTPDGFFKPELAAPGRVMVGAVPTSSTLTALFPDRIVAPGYMWMSGTSFAAPVVSGTASYLLAVHPGWTPDQVKGALMLTADRPGGYASFAGLGVGVVDAGSANGVNEPPNPNAGLNQFVVTDPATGLRSFDAASWSSAAQANASWSSASWSSASWSSASWSSASWSSASWANASWSSASWANASWASASWSTGWLGVG
jgi:serine protease AprX